MGSLCPVLYADDLLGRVSRLLHDDFPSVFRIIIPLALDQFTGAHLKRNSLLILPHPMTMKNNM